jgi:ATP/maltotriose-dependent transcriptional regulator MalT
VIESSVQRATARGEGRAIGHLEQLTERTAAAGTGWALGIEARSWAQLNDDQTAEAPYHEAIDRLGRTWMCVAVARSHRLFGEWLRRERRLTDAREQLRTAYDMFVSMGADAFAGRARRELLATGETARRRTVETISELTPREAHVARLARNGLSNPEIGARLLLSPRTRRVPPRKGLHEALHQLADAARPSAVQRRPCRLGLDTRGTMSALSPLESH